jgi:hypothetical protein
MNEFKDGRKIGAAQISTSTQVSLKIDGCGLGAMTMSGR